MKRKMAIEIETLWRGGVYFYNLTQILQLVKYSKDNFLKDLKRDYEYFGYQTFQKLMDKETITFGNDIYISNDIFEFYDFENRRKDKRKVV